MRIKQKSPSERIMRALAISLTVMVVWILVWALVLKLCNRDDMINNYYNLKDMSLIDRIKWDLIPFNYRGSDDLIRNQIIITVLNCFVLAPFGVTFRYIFKKTNLLRDLAFCFAFSFAIETIQLFTPIGNPATEDLITNVFGYFIGLVFYYVFIKRLSAKWGAFIFTLFNLAAVALTAYSVVTTVEAAPLIYQLITRSF